MMVEVGPSGEVSAKFVSAYAHLRKQAVEGDLVPEQRLDVQTLVHHFEISATPVRDALARLAFEGFISRKMNQGYFTKAFSVDEQRQLIELNLVLHSACVRRALPRMTQEMIAQLKALATDARSQTSAQSYFSALEKINGVFGDEASNDELNRALKITLDRTFLVRKLDMEARFDSDHAVGALRMMGQMLHEGEVSAMVQVTRRIVEGRLERLPQLVQQANAQAMNSQNYYN